MGKLAESTARSPPPSPTKFALRSLITGVPPTDPATHAQRWHPSSSKPHSVAGLVKAFEKNSLSSSNSGSLSSSRPYSTHIPSPKFSPPLSPSPTSSSPPTRNAGTPTVPASFFQAQQSRRPPPPSQAPTEKENRRSPLPRESLSKPLPSLADRDASSEVSCTGASDGAHSHGSGSSFVTAESSILATVSHAHIEHVQQATPRRVLVAPSIVQTAPTPRREERRQERPMMVRSSPTSNFVEALPVSFPSYEQPNLVGGQEYARVPLEEAPKGRQRASTLGGGSRAPGPMAETEREKALRVEREFAELIDTLQLSSHSVRTGMHGVTQSVKEGMLRAAAASSLAPRPSHSRGRSLNLDAPLAAKKESGLRTLIRKTKSSTSLRPQVEVKRPGHARSTSGGGMFGSWGKSGGARSRGEDPMWWAVRIRSARCVGVEETELSVEEVGRLRGRLRAEQPSWVDEFIKHGGYLGLLEKLKELLDVEWREEQHDDQMLYEILRCFKALTMTSVGKRALASRSPTPFTQLTALLFSEKHPGDLPSRQLLVELLHSLFDICPENAAPIPSSAWNEPITLVDSNAGGERRYMRKMKGGEEEEIGRERRAATHEMVKSLLRGPPDAKEEAKVDFIKAVHKPRVFQAWVNEISDVVRDYFWVFCHHGNVFGNLEDIDEDNVEAPKVPTGMTGGVENESMIYCMSQFRLINAVASTCPDPKTAFRLHYDLYESGLRKVLLTLRRASIDYYAPLHLEIARYIHHARSAHFNLGGPVLRFVDARTLSRPEQQVLREYRLCLAAEQNSGQAPQLAEVSF